MRPLVGPLKTIVFGWAILAALFHIYAVIAIVPATLLCTLHLFFLLPLGFLLYPASSKSPKDSPSPLDYLLAACALVCAGFLAWNYYSFEVRWYQASPVSTVEVVLGTINILLIVEATRRFVSPVMAILEGLFILHLLVGQKLPGFLHHPGFTYPRFVEIFYLNKDQGIYGALTGISATYVILFVLFGAFIVRSGVGVYFTDLANKITGRFAGGPAKVAVLSSGFFGMISGIGTANIFSTGSFTIPLMLKMGFSREYSAAVVSTASTGGQYMPPIMGAAAFIMAQFIGIPYVQLAMHASLSAVLYYTSIMFCIHMQAKIHGSRQVEAVDILPWNNLLLRGFYIVPLLSIVGILIAGYSPMYAGLAAIATTIVVSYIQAPIEKRYNLKAKETENMFGKMTLRTIAEALETGVKNSVMVAVACAGAGCIVASVSHTALGLTIVSSIIKLSHNNLFLALLLTAGMSLILGTGMPTTPAYILASSLAVPALVNMGINIVVAHLFVLYYAIISEETPPVAICACAAASLAKADPIKTAVEACKLALAGFIVPMAMAYNTSLALIGSWHSILISIVLVTFGLWFINGGFQGWMWNKIGRLNRTLFVLLGLGCCYYRFEYAAMACAAGVFLMIALKKIRRPANELA